MSTITLPGTPEAYAAGANAGNYVAKAADAAANFACSLYKTYPGAIVGNPVNAAQRGLYDSLCKDRPSGLPTPPQSQFTGGQCACVGYNITYNQVTSGGVTQFTAFLVGKIRGLERVPNSGFPVTYRWSIVYEPCSGGQPTGQVGKFPIASAASDATTYIIAGIARSNGQPDNCGNPAPTYPPETYNPPPGYNSGNGTVQYNDGTDLTVPVVYAPISPQFELNPKFNVDVGGLNFQFDLGGVTVNLGDGQNPPSSPRDPFNDSSDDFDRIDRRLDSIDDRLDGIEDALDNGGPGSQEPPLPPEAPPPDEDPTLDKEPKTEEDSKEETGVERLKWVKIVLTKLPDKLHFGEGAPNCYFAGWFEFKSKEACYERSQINFATSLFLAPAGADGYAYTLTNGAKGYAIVYRKKESS